jgi:type IV secretion system protein VirB6
LSRSGYCFRGSGSFPVKAATTLGVAGGDLQRFVTDDLPDAITATITGDEGDTIEEQIDGNLAAMQFAMSSIDAINIVQDPTLDDDKKRAMTMVAVGTAGPAMIGGAMLLLYQVALALFLGLGPLFILCLIFDQTKSLFNRWLMYGISTMFSMAVLSAMIAIATKLVLGVAGAFWTTTTLSALTGISLTDGMTTIALQQGGVGLLLTVLIVTTPPMAAQFFNGAVGSASAFSQMGQGRGDWRSSATGTGAPSVGRPGANPGEAGYRGQSGVNSAENSTSYNPGSPSRAPTAGYNNPATNANYGTAPPVQPQGLRGAASVQNTNNPASPNPPPAARERDDS